MAADTLAPWVARSPSPRYHICSINGTFSSIGMDFNHTSIISCREITVNVVPINILDCMWLTQIVRRYIHAAINYVIKRKIVRRNFILKKKIIRHSAFETPVCKMTAILSRPQCVNKGSHNLWFCGRMGKKQPVLSCHGDMHNSAC